MNTFGNIFRVEIFGESHGPALGCTLDGLPAGFQLDLEDIVFELSRRRPRQSIESTARREADSFEILSGFFRGRFTGMPLTAVFHNSDAKPADYCGTAARPSHADYAANRKYGGYNDPRGGGAFSGRLTAPLVFAGAIAKQLLREHGIRVFSHVLRIGNISDLRFEPCMCEQPMLDPFFPLVAPNRRSAFEELFEKAAAGKTSLGGIVECAALLEPESAFFGEPFFDGVESMISHIVFSIPGIHGIEFGAGFGFADLDGASANDRILSGGKTKTNNSGGINGGIANGMPIVFRACFRPVPTVMREQVRKLFLLPADVTTYAYSRADVPPSRLPPQSLCSILFSGSSEFSARRNIPICKLFDLRSFIMNELDGFRAEIDRIDTELARLLELRFDLCEEIGRYKRMNGLPIENCEREKELVAARTEGMLSHRSDAVAVFRMIIRRAKRIQKEKLNLYLVGMPGSGKSRTARRLARAIEKPVADTDKLIIDKQGMSIDEIFDTHGEAFFREIESETLLGVAERGGHVVATGGGILTVERNIPIIKGSGIVVFLNRDISILLNAKTSNRPLIRGGREAVLKLYAERIETYRKCADLIVDPDSAGCIGRILDYYKRITE